MSALPSLAQPPRLLHVFPVFAPGGAEVRTARLIGSLSDDFRHSVLATNGDVSASAWIPGDVMPRFLPAVPKAGLARMVPRLRRVLNVEKPDLVLTYGFGAFDAAVAAKTLGIPVIHHEDGFNADEASGFKMKRVLARRFVLPTLHKIVVPSSTLRDLAMRLWRVPAERVAFIPNGIDAPSRSTATKAELGIPDDVPVIAFVGNLRTEKNVSRLLTACASLQGEWRALIIGEGPERASLEAQAAPLGGRVRFLGRRSDPWRLAPAIDVFALSSDTEQMPISVLEAMACAKPVIATDVGDIRAMLPEGSKRFVVPPAEYAAALARLVSDRTLRAELGAKNERHAREHYSHARMVAAYRDLYLGAV